jgi:hypothetical protein
LRLQEGALGAAESSMVRRVPLCSLPMRCWGRRSLLTERERTDAVVPSEPYLLAVSGGEACLTSIDAVGNRAFAAPPHPARVRPLRGSVNDRGV